MAGYGKILYLLKLYGIINEDDSLNIRFASKLTKQPELLRQVTELTSFLQYSAALKIRIHCLLQGITKQPVCCMCGVLVKMRIAGKYVNTFPQTCSTKCTNKNPNVNQKRKTTNLGKYGCEYIFQNCDIRNKIKQAIYEQHGVNSVLSLDSVKQKRTETLQSKKTK